MRFQKMLYITHTTLYYTSRGVSVRRICLYYNTRRVRNNLITIITAERYYCLSLCCDTKQPAISRARRTRRSDGGVTIIVGAIV